VLRVPSSFEDMCGCYHLYRRQTVHLRKFLDCKREFPKSCRCTQCSSGSARSPFKAFLVVKERRKIRVSWPRRLFQNVDRTSELVEKLRAWFFDHVRPRSRATEKSLGPSRLS
jgi:hypothetical protein